MGLLGLLLTVLVTALIIAVVFWAIGLFGFDAKIMQIVRAIIGIIFLIWILQLLFGGGGNFGNGNGFRFH